MSLIFTRFEQSGFLLETPSGARIAFDIGMATSQDVAKTIHPDLVVVSHVHGDHFNIDNVLAMNAPIVAPSDVVEKLSGENIRAFLIEAGATFGFADISITGFTVDHGPISAPIVNLGYVISCKNQTIFFAGDMKVPNAPAVSFDTIFVPVGGNKVFSSTEAADFLSSIHFSGKAIPIHTEMAAEEGAASNFESEVPEDITVLNLSVGTSVQL